MCSGELCGTCYLSAVRFVKRDERKYYESLMQYSREHLMVCSGV